MSKFTVTVEETVLVTKEYIIDANDVNDAKNRYQEDFLEAYEVDRTCIFVKIEDVEKNAI